MAGDCSNDVDGGRDPCSAVTPTDFDQTQVAGSESGSYSTASGLGNYGGELYFAEEMNVVASIAGM